MSDAISISFCINDKYAQHLAVVITSILINNPDDDFVFHVLHSDVTDASIAKVKMLETMYPRHRIEFHRIDGRMFSRCVIPEALEHITIQAFYRYALPEVLRDEERTIYLDVDILAVGSIRSLWDTDLKGNILAAVSEGEKGLSKKERLGLLGPSPYFNSGVLIMDLVRMRAEDATKKLLDNTVVLVDKLAWADQDVINYTYFGRISALDEKWNSCLIDYSPWRKDKDVVVWHFVNATAKPWCNIWKNRTWLIYLKYLRQSSYAGESWRFVWGHIKGFFFFKYTKKKVTRYLVCGIRVWRRKQKYTQEAARARGA